MYSGTIKTSGTPSRLALRGGIPSLPYSGGIRFHQQPLPPYLLQCDDDQPVQPFPSPLPRQHIGGALLSPRQQLVKFIALFQMVHLSSGIFSRALKLITAYAKSHSLDIPDALIAATVLEHKARLFTYNLKDFRFIPDLLLV